MLRYRVRDASHQSGWRKASELIEAPTDKAAGKERDRRMREINAQNETAQMAAVQSAISLKSFSSGFWDLYLRNKGAKFYSDEGM